jgi:glutathione synthase/RimK-type ligase-like ATP-grasp enzyme
VARVALATCAELPELDEDERLVLPELQQLGVDAAVEVWDDESVRWDAYELVVIRSTWDYQDRRAVYLRWAASLPRVLNPLLVLAWNTDKTYLRELAARGIDCVATTWIEPGTDVEALALSGGEVVVKPAVSAGSQNTERYGDARDQACVAHVQRLLDAGHTVMMQPYVASVDRVGETALLYIDGAFSHAINKAATLVERGATEGRLFAPEVITPAVPASEDRAAAERLLDTLQWPRTELLYARVDIVHGDNGQPFLLEVELTEPSLYFGFGDGSADRFATAVVRRLESG